jgi:hypothetical protein
MGKVHRSHGGTPTGQPPPAERDGDRDGCGRGAPRPLLRHRLGRVPPRLLGGARTHQPGRAGLRGLQRADRVAGRVRAPPPARDHRTFPTPTGAANFAVTDVLAAGSIELVDPEGPAAPAPDAPVSHDQYNTTIYGLDDRYRGIRGAPPDRVRAIIAFDLPRGNAAAYFPEANALVPLGSVADRSNTPTSKSVVIRLRPRHAPPR